MKYPQAGNSLEISWMRECCHCVEKKALGQAQIISGMFKDRAGV